MNNVFFVEQKALLAILTAMQPICTKRTTLDSTAFLLFTVGPKELVIKGTDLEISLQSSYVLKQSELRDNHSFLVSGRRIFELVKELEQEIVCTLTDNLLLLTAGKVRVSLHIKDPQEFPPFPERIENLMQFDTQFLTDIITKVAFLIPQNSANPALNGLLLEISSTHCTFTATDGHCLMQCKSEQYTLAQPKKWLLPRRAIFEVKKIVENCSDSTIFLGTCNNQLVFSGDSFNFFTKLLSDPFPEYATILEHNDFIPARIERNQFIKTLRRASCLLSGQFIATKFDIMHDTMKIFMHNKEVGTLEEEIPLQDFTQDPLDIRFYAPYLLNGLQVFCDKIVQFYVKNSAKPIIFYAQEHYCQVIYLVMPVAPTHG